MITPYALMMNDPTTECMVCWIDERSGATDDPQTLRYGPSDTEMQSSVRALPGVSAYVHHAHITGQEPGALVALSLPDEDETFPPVKMLPSRVPFDGIVGLSVSDMHCGARTIDTPAKFEFLGAERPDFIIMAGDSSGNQWRARNTSNSNGHIAAFRDYFSQWWADGDFLPQMLCDGGNHWLGNTPSNGSNAPSLATGQNSDQIVPENDNYFDDFHPNARLINPVGAESWGGPIRHMSVKIGNWMQVFSGDVYSNTVASAASAFLDAHDPKQGLCVFMCHSPMFSQGNRTSGDPPLQALMRDNFFKALAERENCLFSFGGNIHLDTITKPLSWYESDPGAPSVALDDGYAAPAEPGEWRTIVEMGEGCIGGRPLLSEPVVPSEIWDRFEVEPLNYYLMRFTPGKVVVEDKDETGVRDSREFLFPLAERADGSLARPYAANGSPLRPRRAS